MAPTGGTRYQTLCDQSAAGEDSTDLFDEPSASSDGQLAFLRGSFLDQPLDHLVGRDPLALGCEVGHDPMPQHRGGQGRHVFEV
jgi:hypothetical protein